MARRRKLSSPVAVAIVVVVLALALVLEGPWTRNVRAIAWGALSPLHRAWLSIAGGDSGGEAARELDRLRVETLMMKELEDKVRRLEEILELKENFPLKLVAARIIGRDASFWSGTVVLDAGLDKGFHPGLGVISPQGVVGHIVDVYATTSRVLLLTDASSRIDAYVARTGDEGIVEGKTGNLCRIKYLDSEGEIEVGDLVVTGGLDGIFPQGLPVGRIAMVSRERYAMFQEAEITPKINLDALREVLVILPEARPPKGR
jgi:rod shape-determining protein MreC